MNTILQRFTGEWAVLLQPEAILTVCREIGYTAWRDRVLTLVTTIMQAAVGPVHPAVQRPVPSLSLDAEVVRAGLSQSTGRCARCRSLMGLYFCGAVLSDQ